MSYALVHLEGDEATANASRMVEHLRRVRPPVVVRQESTPDHAELRSIVEGLPSPASAVCIGHGSQRGLGPDSSTVWASSEDLGSLFPAGRLYAYACDTAGGLESLGARAVEAGVDVFVGHEGPVLAPLPPSEKQMVTKVATAAIVGFVDGIDDENALRQLVYDAVDEAVDDVPIDWLAIRHGEPNFWSQSSLLDKLGASLRVHRRSDAAR